MVPENTPAEGNPNNSSDKVKPPSKGVPQNNKQKIPTHLPAERRKWAPVNQPMRGMRKPGGGRGK